MSLEPAFDESAPTVSPEEIILVVEDDKAAGNTHVSVLRELSDKVLHAGSDAEALAMVQSHRTTSLLLTHVMMPDMTGRIIADTAGATMPGLRVLYTTGYTSNGIVHNRPVAEVGLLRRGISLKSIASVLVVEIC